MTHVYRDKMTPQRVLVPLNGIEFKEEGQWSIQTIEVSVAASDGRIIARKTFIPFDTLESHYRKEEL